MTDPQVVIGRQAKRIAKLTQQRDYFRQRCDLYKDVLNMHPFIERQHKSVMDARKERERVRGLEDRIKEQALLIQQLTAAKKESA